MLAPQPVLVVTWPVVDAGEVLGPVSATSGIVPRALPRTAESVSIDDVGRCSVFLRNSLGSL
jgi:hypothetical protein